MPRPAPREKSRSTERLTFNELFLAQQQETNKRLDQMDKRLDRVENRMDKLEEKLETTRQELKGRIDKLADKIDDMHKEIKSSSNHGQIATISTIGIAIAVIYSLLR